MKNILCLILSGISLMLVSCNTNTEQQYQLLIKDINKPEMISEGVLYLPVKLTSEYQGGCEWEIGNGKRKLCRAVIVRDQLTVDLDPSLIYKKTVLLGEVKNNTATGVVKFIRRKSMQKIATFKLTPD